MKRIECIIMDWAGTAVDYGCFAPSPPLSRAFGPSAFRHCCQETRAHMGLTKVEEIRALFNIERVRAEFERKFSRPAGEEDVRHVMPNLTGVVCLARRFIPTLFPVWWKRFRTACARRIRIGSTHRLYPLYDGCCAACRHSQRLCGIIASLPDGLPAGRPAPLHDI